MKRVKKLFTVGILFMLLNMIAFLIYHISSLCTSYETISSLRLCLINDILFIITKFFITASIVLYVYEKLEEYDMDGNKIDIIETKKEN